MLDLRCSLVRKLRCTHIRFQVRVFDFTLPNWSHSIATIFVGLLDIENKPVAVRIALLFSKATADIVWLKAVITLHCPQ